jgi:hypothetical protein
MTQDRDRDAGNQQGGNQHGSERFVEALGLAALDLWSELPHDVQHKLFEQAVLCGHKSERDEALREQLAAFLHGQHQRTAKRTGEAGKA